MSMSINKFYWNVVTHLFTNCGCFHATTAELSGCDRGRVACKAKNIYYLTLSEKVC